MHTTNTIFKDLWHERNARRKMSCLRNVSQQYMQLQVEDEVCGPKSLTGEQPWIDCLPISTDI